MPWTRTRTSTQTRIRIGDFLGGMDRWLKSFAFTSPHRSCDPPLLSRQHAGNEGHENDEDHESAHAVDRHIVEETGIEKREEDCEEGREESEEEASVDIGASTDDSATDASTDASGADARSLP